MWARHDFILKASAKWQSSTRTEHLYLYFFLSVFLPAVHRPGRRRHVSDEAMVLVWSWRRKYESGNIPLAHTQDWIQAQILS